VGPEQRDAAALAAVLNDGGSVERHLSAELQAEVNEHAHGKMAAIIIWLGMCLDGIPESLVLGILANGVPDSYPSLVGFCAAVGLANFPEAMSSSGTMKACGMKSRTILGMWFAMFIGTGCGALIGSAAFPTDGDEYTREIATAAIVGVCGGATLSMVANTVLPEAFEQGGDVVGLSCLMGFMAAMIVKAVGIELSKDDSSSS